jgi:hypothetical protein
MANLGILIDSSDVEMCLSRLNVVEEGDVGLNFLSG